MNKPNFIEEYKAAKARGDDEGMRDALHRASEWRKANPKEEKPRRADVAGDLRWARERNTPKEAERATIDAVKQGEAHLLSPNDLVWVVRKIGALKSSWTAGQAIAAWLFHHGPVHRALVEVAEEIADHDDARWLDDVLVWIEPTPYRWFQHACWLPVFVGWELEERLGRKWQAHELHSPDVAHIYKGCAEVVSEHARRVVLERGSGAYRSLRVAPGVAEAHDARAAQLILEAWGEALT